LFEKGELKRLIQGSQIPAEKADHRGGRACDKIRDSYHSDFARRCEMIRKNIKMKVKRLHKCLEKNKEREVSKMREKDWARGLSLLLVVVMIFIMVSAWSCQAQEKKEHGKSLVEIPAASIPSAKEMGRAFVEVAKKVKPSVVSIRVERTITVTPWRGFGEDFFRGTPFEDFFRFRPKPP